MENTIQTQLEMLKLEISKHTTFKEKINTLADYIKGVTGAERCSLFIFKEDKEQLVSIYNDGVQGSITLKSNIGLVGYAFHKRKTVLENDVAHSPLFFRG
jgi:signal transduction protein with GAF and PtsI domain